MKPTKKELINIIKNYNEDPKKVNIAVNLVIQNGGIDYAYKRMMEIKNQALELLKEIPENDAKKALIGLVEFTVQREN